MTDRTLDQLLDAWMDLGPTVAPERVGEAARLEVRTTRQLPAVVGRWAPRRSPDMNSTVRIVLAAAAVVTAALLGYNYLVAPNVGLPASSFAPSSTPTPRSEASPSMLPELRIPTYGALGNTEPKDYGWTGAAGSSADMHNVDLHAEMVFAVESHQLDCFARGEGPEPVPTTVAGFEGLYVEPYGDDPRARFQPGDPVTTGAYALAIGDRTLCVYLSWGPEASPAQRATAREVLDSLRAQPFGVDGVRIVFTTLGWDNG